MIPEDILHKTSLMLASLLGWDFPQNRRNELERGILATARELGIKETSDAIISWLVVNQWESRDLNILASYLTVGETYFFREKTGLEVFQKQIIPGILKERQGKDQYLRIWSAGCCSGEEPYTLAILLHEIIPDFQNWRITILATDINHNFLKKAQAGIYTPWSFRETSQTIKNKYFTCTGKNWEIIPEIKKMITFAALNLAKDQYPSELNNTHNMDVLFCRNVLMYFTPEQISLVAQRFYRSLSENGWLITSAVEMNNDYFSDFVSLSLEQGIFYRKITKTTGALISPNLKTLIGKVSRSGKTVLARKPKPTRSLTPISTSTGAVPELKEGHPSSRKEIQILYEKGQYQLCVELCLTLLKKKPLESAILTLLVKSYANMGNLTDARKWGEKLLSQDEFSVDSYYLVATILMEENETTMAESILKRALYLDPHHILSHFLMGNITNRLGKKHLSAKHFQNVKELLSPLYVNEVVPGSDGLTAGRIRDIVETFISNLRDER